MPQCWNHNHADRVTCCGCGLWLSKKGHELAVEMAVERQCEWRTHVPDKFYKVQVEQVLQG